MKKILLLLAILLLYNPFKINANVNWMSSLEDAKTLSKALNKPILIDFWAIWCGPCKQMDRDVWSQDEIGVLMNNFVPVQIDIDTNQSLARFYGVNAIPNIIIIDGWGNKLYESLGYKNKNEIKKLLESFSVNMATVNQAMTILEKDENNIYSNLRVAQKFQNIAFVIEGKALDAFLDRSNFYLKTSSKLLPDDSIVLAEKIALLQLLNKAYGGNSKSALKNLENDFDKVDESNQSLYCFLQFYCNHVMENKEKATINYEALVALNDAVYLEKAAYLMK